ncbi:MAG: AI-2E family transporter [Myxococcota bacterium]
MSTAEIIEEEAETAPEGPAASRSRRVVGPAGALDLVDAEPVGPHLWQIRAVRDFAILALVVAGLAFALTLIQAVAPILIGFLGAYLIAPLVRWLEERGIRRGIVVAVATLMGIGLLVGSVIFLVPRLAREISRLQDRLPKYIDVIRVQTGYDIENLWTALDLSAALGALDRVEPLLGIVGSVVGTTAYGLVFIVLLLVSFTVFNLEFEHLPLLTRYVPKSRRERWEPAAKVVVDVFRGFLRGQLLVMVFTTTVFEIGFALIDVPYSAVAALVGGVFSIIPYGQVAGPVLAILLNLLESQVTGTMDPVQVFVLPGVIYGLMQSLESFVVTPVVQGAATRLHPLAILACLAAGGSIGGILGIFLAIPITASLWLIAKDRFFPAWRRWAEEH